MKAIIIEDEKLNVKHLKYLLEKIEPLIEIVAVWETVKESREALINGVSADVIFLDVHLADGNSFEIFKGIEINIPIIFTTAFNEYAIKAFKLNSIDYLLKPVGIDELSTAWHKFKKNTAPQNNSILNELLISYQQMNKQYKSRFMVKSGDSILSIEIQDIVYFISEDGVVLVVTNNNHRYAVDFNLEQLEGIISPEFFIRMNRKIIIHLKYIEKTKLYFNNRLKIVAKHLDEINAVVSRERVNDFKEWLGK